MRVLSFGAGVQSTAVLLAAHLGLIEPIDLVIFADTHAEPRAVYEWMNFVTYFLKQEIVTVSKGDIISDSLSTSGERFASAPFFIENEKGERGMLRRQCTADYKIKPVHDYLRQFKGQPITLLMGISVDEAQRAKVSRVKWIRHEFPLLWPELSVHCGGILAWNRQRCIEFVEKEMKRTPPRSACFMCPYHSDDEWLLMKEKDPEAFALAVDFDDKIRRMTRIDGDAFVHASLKPLGEVKFIPGLDPAQIQFGMMDECDGVCGV